MVLRRTPDQTAAGILREVQAAVWQYGTPRSIRTDNAAVFRCEAFRHGLQRLGIHQEFSAPGKPWQNGRIERLFLTLKQKLNLLLPGDGASLDGLLTEFRYFYNHVRPHQHLYGWTPYEAWHGINPYRPPPRRVRNFVGWGGLLIGTELRY